MGNCLETRAGTASSLYDRLGVESGETNEERERREARETAIERLTRGMRTLHAKQAHLHELATNESRRALEARAYKRLDLAMHCMRRRAACVRREEALQAVELKLFDVKLEISIAAVTADAVGILKNGGDALAAEVKRIGALDVDGIIDALQDCSDRVAEFETTLLDAPSFASGGSSIFGESTTTEDEDAELMRQLDALQNDPPSYVEPERLECASTTTIETIASTYNGVVRSMSGVVRSVPGDGNQRSRLELA